MKSIKDLRSHEDFQNYMPLLIKQLQEQADKPFEKQIHKNINQSSPGHQTTERGTLENNQQENISQSKEYALHASAPVSALNMKHIVLNPITFIRNKSMVGEYISHYHILEKLGVGGMGVVYKAKDLVLERFVTIKFLSPHLLVDTTAKKRFIHEARNLSALDHSNICSIYEICETQEGFLFIVMPYYEGQTLRSMIDGVGAHSDALIRDGVGTHSNVSVPIDRCIDIMIQIAQGLAKAHEKGIVHRDIKPDNIIITEDNVVKIIDFGLSKLNERTKLSEIGITMGTTPYMSPDQTWGMEVDHRTDIWSLGVVLYEMLSGKLPFRGSYEQAIIYSIVNEEPEKIYHIPEKLWKIVKKCLTKETQDRYESMQELIADLQDYQSRYLTDSTEYIVTSLNKIKRKWAILVLFIMMVLPVVVDWF